MRSVLATPVNPAHMDTAFVYPTCYKCRGAMAMHADGFSWSCQCGAFAVRWVELPSMSPCRVCGTLIQTVKHAHKDGYLCERCEQDEAIVKKREYNRKYYEAQKRRGL